jgi:hypothetical protein
MEQSIFSNKKMHLDKKVWFVMLITAFICIGLVSYSFVTKERCIPFSINIQGLTMNDDGSYQVGDPVFFRASLATKNELVWDFGDKSEKQKSRSVTVKHTYIKPGSYFVSAVANGTCYNEEIKVKIKEFNGTATKGIKVPKILGNTSPKEGQPQIYISDYIGGNNYEWSILDKSNFPTISGQSAKYTFPKPGIYRIQLTVDHDRNNKRAILEVNVTEAAAVPKPIPHVIPQILPPRPRPTPAHDTAVNPTPAPPEPKPAVPEPTPVNHEPVTPALVVKNKQIGNRGFKAMLQSVVAGETQLEEFDEFLFHKGKTAVKISDVRGVLNFSQLFNKIKGKKYEVENVNLLHDPNDPTIITKIEVQLKDTRPFYKKPFGEQ